MVASLKSDAIFDKIKDRLAENPAKGKQINAVFLYKITTTTSNGAPVKHWSEYASSQQQLPYHFRMPTTGRIKLIFLRFFIPRQLWT